VLKTRRVWHRLQNGSVDRSKDGHFPIRSDRSSTTLRREHSASALALSSATEAQQATPRFEQRPGGWHLRPPDRDSLFIRGPGDLLPLIKSSLHVRSRLASSNVARGLRSFTRYFLLFIGAPRDGFVCVRYRLRLSQFVTRLQFIAADLAK